MHTLELPAIGLQASITVFSPAEAEDNGLESWSLGPLQRQSDALRNQQLAWSVLEALDERGIKEAYAPNIAPASARIVNTSDLTNCISFGGARLYRNQGVPADGVFLDPGQAFIGSFAGCGVIIAAAGEDMIVAHAASRSLLDHGMLDGKPAREHFSVVHAIIEKFQKRGFSVRDMMMVMLFSIPPLKFEHSVEHPVYGEHNRKLIKFVDAHYPGGIIRTNDTTYLDVETVFVEQARVERVAIKMAMHRLDQYPDLAQTAQTNRRNLVFVKRTI